MVHNAKLHYVNYMKLSYLTIFIYKNDGFTEFDLIYQYIHKTPLNPGSSAVEGAKL